MFHRSSFVCFLIFSDLGDCNTFLAHSGWNTTALGKICHECFSMIATV